MLRLCAAILMCFLLRSRRCQNYIGWTFQWIRTFREGALTLPWGEDWIWQTPVGSQQMMTLSIDAMRSGV